jgi:hypothetical protein
MNDRVPDDLERLLRGVQDRVPPPEPETTSRVAARVLGSFQRRRKSAGRVLLLAAVFLVVGGTGFTAGRWTSPTRAAADITIGARPDTVSLRELRHPFTLFGTISSGRPGESVQIEANECGLSGFFHELEGVRTEGQGVWSMPIPGTFPQSKVLNYIETTTKYRARWNGHLSETVTVYVRSYVNFLQGPPPGKKKKSKPGKRFFVIGVYGRQMKYRPRVVLERRVGNEWKPVVKPVLDRSSLRFLWLPAAKGQVMRVRLPDSEAGPCYLGAVSPPLTVR